jgi:hypothetical protein
VIRYLIKQKIIKNLIKKILDEIGYDAFGRISRALKEEITE